MTTINSLIGVGGVGKVCQNKQTGVTVSQILQIHERKFQQREIDLDQLTDEELRSRYRFDRESIKYLVEILREDNLQGRRVETIALSPIFCATFSRNSK